jgi:hypothetical protein
MWGINKLRERGGSSIGFTEKYVIEFVSFISCLSRLLRLPTPRKKLPAASHMGEPASGRYATITGTYWKLAESKPPILILVILND